MNDETAASYRAQARRCRRIAASMIDDDIRHALEDLAGEYDALAAKSIEQGGDSFMLYGKGSREDHASQS